MVLRSLAPMTLSPHGGGALRHRFDDVLVTRASAEIAFELGANRFLVRVRMPLYQIDRGEHHPRRAEAALQAVALLERRLHRMHLAVACESFDSRHFGRLRLNGENRARLDCVAADKHRARATLPGIAA